MGAGSNSSKDATRRDAAPKEFDDDDSGEGGEELHTIPHAFNHRLGPLVCPDVLSANLFCDCHVKLVGFLFICLSVLRFIKWCRYLTFFSWPWPVGF